MYSFKDLTEQNLPVYVKVQQVSDITTHWVQPFALFALASLVCLSGITTVSYYTFKLNLHPLPPLGLDWDPRLMLFNGFVFLVSSICLGIWLHTKKQAEVVKSLPKDTDTLKYILPVSHSLHIGNNAWDLSDANSIVIDFPRRVVVHFKNPHKTFVLYDDKSGYPLNEKNPRSLKKLSKNGALFVYLSGTELPNRYKHQTNWWWNITASALFVFSTMLPFLFQAMGLTLYWIGFLAIPVSYVALKLGQHEFQDHRVFSYSRFLAANHNHIDTKLYRAPHL